MFSLSISSLLSLIPLALLLSQKYLKDTHLCVSLSNTMWSMNKLAFYAALVVVVLNLIMKSLVPVDVSVYPQTEDGKQKVFHLF